MERGTALTALVTPFDKNGALALEILPELIAFQREGGIDGLVICGTNGEGPSMCVYERKRLLEAVIRLKGSLRIFAGTGAANLPDALDLTRHAAEAGADAALILPPFYFKNVSAQGVAAFYRQIIEAAQLPVLLYSIPQQSAIPITSEILNLLAEQPRLAGVKDSQADAAGTAALVRSHPKLDIFAGADEILSQSRKFGAAGNISGTANGFPELVAAVAHASSDSRREEAQEKLNLAKTIVLQYPLIAGNKSVLANRGVPRMWVRPPLIDLTESQEREMIGRLQAEKLLS